MERNKINLFDDEGNLKKSIKRINEMKEIKPDPNFPPEINKDNIYKQT